MGCNTKTETHRCVYLGNDGVTRFVQQVEVEIDMPSIVYGMGGSACRSKSGRCVDGPVKVRRIGAPALYTGE